ncbi:MAG: AMP-binding protein, partial [Chloroflexi bacterium]|nr:AMP-binding protein [Chloroflexota bacterium]
MATTNEPVAGMLSALLQEDRRYPPSDEFKAQANWSDPQIYERAEADPEAFWAEQARAIDWFKPWDRVLEWDAPNAKWFVGAEVNASYNCVDRHLQSWRRNKAAIIFEGEPGDSRVLTYRDLYREVNRCAAALKRLGVKKGDRVAIYLGMVPELAIAMLACARIGAPHTVIFAGFSADSISDRVNDCGATFAITADGGWRRGNKIPLKDTMDRAMESCPTVKTVLVVNRTDDARQVPMQEGRDVWWHRAMADSGAELVEPERLDAEHPLYILYTSGTTGKPKGMLHTTGGYLVGTACSHKYVFDLKEEDVYWCTADVGWVTGHSYIVYGPLANGATCVMYEGSPDYPDKDRFWEIVEKYGVSILYTAPTAIRTFMRWGKEWPAKHDLSSLRVLGSVGEPINPEAWVWYREVIGGDRCPV